MSIDALRDEVAAAARRLAAEGLLIGTAGNVSAALPDSDLVAVTATGVELATCARDQVTVVDRAGRVVAGDAAPTSELGLHLAFLTAAPEDTVGAVVHTHSPYATAVGCVHTRLPVLHYQQLLLGGDVRVAPFAPFGTTTLTDHVVEAARDRTAALMANHGAVTHGPTLSSAVERALLLEWCCRLFSDASRLGTPRELTAAEQEAVILAAIERNYGSVQPQEPS